MAATELSADEREEIKEHFFSIDKNGDSLISLSELKDALDQCGFKLPGWKVRKIIEEYDDKKATKHVGQLSLDEFEKVIILTANIELTVEIVEENELKTAVKAHTYETFVENE
ncbi:hypothetical protein RUM44_005230 [Polyplax serrata]|uniref:EF-hand domain-containing protein n=1 Tax=Polyplax serrata TaxID=468196 RepID=A0ABR1AEF1_POLSC